MYKKSHCTLTALMTQIETYCGCYISYMNDIERYINTTSNVKRKIKNQIEATKFRFSQLATFISMEYASGSFLVVSRKGQKPLFGKNRVENLVAKQLFDCPYKQWKRQKHCIPACHSFNYYIDNIHVISYS